MCKSSWVAVVVGVVSSLVPWVAHASQVQVSPTRLSLSPEAPVAVLTLNNTGTEVARFEIDVSAWDEGEDGQMLLEPSSALAVFPRIVEIEPGQTRPIRVAVRGASGAAQRTYRVFIAEMPGPSPTPKRAIHVLSRFGVPVFVGPATVEHQLQVASVRLGAGGDLQIRLANAGSGFAFVRKISVRAASASVEWAGWYLLAYRQRAYQGRLELEGDAPQRVDVTLELEDGTILTQSVPVAR